MLNAGGLGWVRALLLHWCWKFLSCPVICKDIELYGKKRNLKRGIMVKWKDKKKERETEFPKIREIGKRE